MEKLIENIGVHLTAEQAAQVKSLAEFRGLKSSQYLRDVVLEKLESERAQYERMAAVFGAPASIGSEGSLDG